MFNLASKLDPIRATLAPYALAIKVGLALLLLTLAFAKGCSVQKQLDAGELEKKNTALMQASAQLSAAASALQAVNDETDRQVAEAKQREDDAKRAARIADQAKARAERRAAVLAKAIADARRKPACRALLDADISEVCQL